jgi:hypothetical protein
MSKAKRVETKGHHEIQIYSPEEVIVLFPKPIYSWSKTTHTIFVGQIGDEFFCQLDKVGMLGSYIAPTISKAIGKLKRAIKYHQIPPC